MASEVKETLKEMTESVKRIKTVKQKEAKMMMLHKEIDMNDIQNYRLIILLSHMHKLFTRILQKQMEQILDENQQREQASFRKGYSTEKVGGIWRRATSCSGRTQP